jgi:hypothetical protein
LKLTDRQVHCSRIIIVAMLGSGFGKAELGKATWTLCCCRQHRVILSRCVCPYDEAVRLWSHGVECWGTSTVAWQSPPHSSATVYSNDLHSAPDQWHFVLSAGCIICSLGLLTLTGGQHMAATAPVAGAPTQ